MVTSSQISKSIARNRVKQPSAFTTGKRGSGETTDTSRLYTGKDQDQESSPGPFFAPSGSEPSPDSAWESNGDGLAKGGWGDTLLDPYKKVRVLKLAGAVKEAGWIEVGEKIGGCGTMGKRYRCRDCGYEWTVGDWCNHRLCPECGKRRAYALFNAHKRLAGRPNLKHLVLTFKNVDGLTWETVDWVRNCFTRLRNRKLFKNSWRGGVYAIEFTFSKLKGWHIHIHALVDGDYVPQAVISQVWKQITGSSDVVWISRAKSSRQVLKYILKPSHELLDDTEALDNFLTVIQGRHFVSGWGKWYRVSEKQLTDWERVCPDCGSKYIVFVGWVKVDARDPPLDKGA